MPRRRAVRRAPSDPDQPCKAITGGARAEFIHPFEDRNLTVRELARIQTFPDDFVFAGTIAQQEQLIGNAVPPLLASVIANSLAKDLRLGRLHYSDGALLSFVPTLSMGMSPVLAQVSRMVHDTFDVEPEGARQLALWE